MTTKAPGLAVRVYPEHEDSLLAERIMSALSQNDFKLKTLFIEQGRLDEVFRTITHP